jgi:hypothetical protein
MCQTARGQKSPKIIKIVENRALAQEEGTWDNVDSVSYGIGISKVCSCLQKPSGEEVSISVG